MSDLTNHQALRCIAQLRGARKATSSYISLRYPELDDAYLNGLLHGMALATGREPTDAGIDETVKYLLELANEPGL